MSFEEHRDAAHLMATIVFFTMCYYLVFDGHKEFLTMASDSCSLYWSTWTLCISCPCHKVAEIWWNISCIEYLNFMTQVVQIPCLFPTSTKFDRIREKNIWDWHHTRYLLNAFYPIPTFICISTWNSSMACMIHSDRIEGISFPDKSLVMSGQWPYQLRPQFANHPWEPFSPYQWCPFCDKKAYLMRKSMMNFWKRNRSYI